MSETKAALRMAGAAPARTCVHCGVEVGTEFICWSCGKNTRHFTETTEEEMYEDLHKMMLRKEEDLLKAQFRFAAGSVVVLLVVGALSLLLPRYGPFTAVLCLAMAALFLRPAIRARGKLAEVRKGLEPSEERATSQ